MRKEEIYTIDDILDEVEGLYEILEQYLQNKSIHMA